MNLAVGTKKVILGPVKLGRKKMAVKTSRFLASPIQFLDPLLPAENAFGRQSCFPDAVQEM